jgi:tyrosyl-tRNA synthetase
MEPLELIKRNTEEIVTEEELKALLKQKKHPNAYVGYATTGKLHIGHLIPIVKIGDFIRAGFRFTFLCADLHAYLDDKKSPWELLKARSRYTELIVRECLNAIGVPDKDVTFVEGSSYQLSKAYWMDVLKYSGEVTFERCRRAAAEVVRFGDHPKLGGFIYPLMQNLDVHYLKADVAYGGIDQRGIYMLGRETLPSLGYKKPISVFTPLIPSITGGKMSASEVDSKVDILEDPEVLKKKLSQAFCPAGQAEDNAVLMYAKFVVFPALESLGRGFSIKRPEKFGGNADFKDYNSLEQAFVARKLHPLDLKTGLAIELANILEPVRRSFVKHKALLRQAYPEQ